MAAYQTFTLVRTTRPDPASLLKLLRVQDATAGIVELDYVPNTLTIKKATPWTGTQITGTQTIIETAPIATPQSLAQAEIEAWPISVKALVLTLIDQLNTIRAALPAPLPAITPAQALAAVRVKAGTL